MAILWGLFTIVFWVVIVTGITALISFISRSVTKKRLLAEAESKYDKEYAKSYSRINTENVVVAAITTGIIVLLLGSLLGSLLPPVGETPLKVKDIKKTYTLYNMARETDVPFYVQYNNVDNDFVYLTDSFETNKQEYKNIENVTKFEFDKSIIEPRCEVHYAEYKYFWQHIFLIDVPGMFGCNTVNVIYLPSAQNISYMALMKDSED